MGHFHPCGMTVILLLLLLLLLLLFYCGFVLERLRDVASIIWTKDRHEDNKHHRSKAKKDPTPPRFGLIRYCW